MQGSANWFLLSALVAVGGWMLGLRLGRNGNPSVGRVGIAVGIILLGTWAWLVRNPSVAVQVIPVSILSMVEGIGAVPIFMLVIGIAWSKSQQTRQKYVVGWACVLGTVYFLHGGIWMLQTTPKESLASEVDRGQYVRQTQYYSCVPAACASALNILGIPTTEAEMGVLTDTRPGSGATMLRAMNGLRKRLATTSFTVELVAPDYNQLKLLPLPAIAPLQFEATMQHMVTLLEISSEHVKLADPTDGILYLNRNEFEEYYLRKVLVFRHKN
ncbi:Peptidase C39 family protein [Poriferisphaera corsica]|uniref:Peptidase C39 family protein n=1 Tax=Poriferisphaera corsica TaxID=2528020 RepID=A0A517YTP3_9BACT|nr:cysteine peptidase family C39 domain-containing protein [Poriferisphaera corsica]QDU33596.1 Peptidase C39 family protein [Poriferisphaera corsica]